MLASYSWLRSLLPALDASPAAVAERLTMSGLEVEQVIEYGAACRHVVVAEVRKVEPHPSRERLTLVTVDRGGGPERVVCGAPNVPAPGRKVVLAPLGTELPAAGITLGARSIGGVPSEGMLCSEAELGLLAAGSKSAGIMVLPEELAAAPGTPLAQALPGCHDFVLALSVTPNRPDALGHVGLARELGALFDLPFAVPVAAPPARVASGRRIEELASVTLDDPERCPRYGAAVVVGLTVGPSPASVRYRLESLGVRAIANVVDATNLVMLEHGQPLHAFDLDKLPGGRVRVRRARPGERMTTLDGVERMLDPDDLLITDGERPLALAGVMGGGDSEVSAGTVAVLLECAHFAPRGVRRTSRRHGLHTEASHRFERGCDPEHVPAVLGRVASLVTELCGGASVPGQILASAGPIEPRRIRYRRARAAALLGMDVPLDRAAQVLGRLGCVTNPSPTGPGELDVTVPSFRPDLGREEDLVEEVMRVHGIERVPARLRPVVPRVGRSAASVEDRVREAAAALGLSEALTFGFVSRRELALLGAPAPAVVLRNPLGDDRSVMRTSLLPGLLDALRRARRRGARDVRLFTVGSLFLPGATSEPLPTERPGFAAVLAGERALGLGRPEPIDLYDAKGVAVEIVERVTRQAAKVDRAAATHLHPRGAAALSLGDHAIGCFGPLHPDIVESLDLGGACQVVELDLSALVAAGRVVPQHRPVPQLPPVMRDLALVASEDVPAAVLAEAIRRAAGERCESVELFDLYRGEGLPTAHRSLGFHLVFRDPKAASDPDHARTLTDAEVDACTAAVIEAVRVELGAVVRS